MEKRYHIFYCYMHDLNHETYFKTLNDSNEANALVHQKNFKEPGNHYYFVKEEAVHA